LSPISPSTFLEEDIGEQLLRSKSSDRAPSENSSAFFEARLALAEGFEHRPVQPVKNRG
jgi:hypothetical protein